MPSFEQLLSFVAAATLIIILPGPATLYVIASTQRSISSGTRAAAGIITGDVILVSLAGLGFAALMQQWPGILFIIKILGAVYIGYLGFSVFNSRNATTRQRSDDSPKWVGLMGIFITLTNPKPILFFGAFFPMFIDSHSGNGVYSFYMLGAVFQAINATYFAMIIGLTSYASRSQHTVLSSSRGIKTFSGVGMMLFGVAILISSGWEGFSQLSH